MNNTNNVLPFINTSLKMTTYIGVCFYTNWGLVLLILYLSGILKKYQQSILLILLTSFFIGMIMTYYHPKVIEIPYIKRTISGKMLKLFNLVFHVLPFLIFMCFYDTTIKNDNMILAVFSILLYVLLFNPLKIYNYNHKCSNCEKQKIVNIILVVYILLIMFYTKNKFF